MTADLHYELVASTVRPTAWLLVTHGIYGSGGNWRSIARKLVERRPEWGVVLVDLRGHGRSPPGDPPHTVAACAADLAALIATLAEISIPVLAACGHSFGGKVVLAHRPTCRLLQSWVLDAAPGARPDGLAGDVAAVLVLLAGLPPLFAERDDFVAAVVAGGQPPVLAQWLAMNLEPVDGGFRLRLDVVQMRELLTDYVRADLWAAVEDPGLPGELHLVIAGASATVAPADRARIGAAPVELHVIPDAGHWLHIDAPDALLDLLAVKLAKPPAPPATAEPPPAPAP